MTIFLRLFLLLSALVVLVMAATVNPMSSPVSGDVLTAGQPFLVEWAVTNNDSVSLFLRKGDPMNLSSVLTIVTQLPNTGVVRWTPPSHLATDTSYTIQIRDDKTGEVNYSPQFTILASDETAPAPSPAAPMDEAPMEETPETSVPAPAPYDAGNGTFPTPTSDMDESEAEASPSATRAPKKGGKGSHPSPAPYSWQNMTSNGTIPLYANMTNGTATNGTLLDTASSASSYALGGMMLCSTLVVGYLATLLF
ncbi:Ser-Thr-rich glycosyl-phosphatidyl-inositol-anchored membrane family-domain-containing protein [Myxozyma melibiosi]|uniref:Ser-Thr-rich glycosyl-phosphatidyl-inositol-anchored membrane family-domain-containing protein n=1 Tax=Myxozyma melibiosi TaxID=54550 RepID=A0ABR1F4G8_9ASCO